jgi:hypothetical protein
MFRYLSGLLQRVFTIGSCTEGMNTSVQHVLFPLAAGIALTASLIAIGAALWLSVAVGALAAARAAAPRYAGAPVRR